jgi:hypothetical protein
MNKNNLNSKVSIVTDEVVVLLEITRKCLNSMIRTTGYTYFHYTSGWSYINHPYIGNKFSGLNTKTVVHEFAWKTSVHSYKTQWRTFQIKVPLFTHGVTSYNNDDDDNNNNNNNNNRLPHGLLLVHTEVWPVSCTGWTPVQPFTQV